MNSAIERLLTLRVADVMNKQVVHVSVNQSMADAARRLLKHSISGAPVVDEQQQCVGILSATDFVKKNGSRQEGSPTNGPEAAATPPDIEDRVADHMTPVVQSIRAEASLLDAARLMCRGHIHRVPVLDRQSRPVGMITALDIVAALVNAIEE
jgi:CBS-domain-containing membrane protein